MVLSQWHSGQANRFNIEVHGSAILFSRHLNFLLSQTHNSFCFRFSMVAGLCSGVARASPLDQAPLFATEGLEEFLTALLPPKKIAESLHKPFPVPIIQHDVSSPVPTCHGVVDRSRILNPTLPRHSRRLPPSNMRSIRFAPFSRIECGERLFDLMILFHLARRPQAQPRHDGETDDQSGNVGYLHERFPS